MKIRTKIDRLINIPDVNLRASASVYLDDVFVVHGFQVIETKDNTFVKMPSRSFADKEGNTKYSDIFHGLNKAAYEAIQRSVMNAYQCAVEQSQNSVIEISAVESEDEGIDEEPEADLSMQ